MLLELQKTDRQYRKAVLTSHIMISIERAYVWETRSDTSGRPRQQSFRHRVDHTQRGGERERDRELGCACGCWLRHCVCVCVCVSESLRETAALRRALNLSANHAVWNRPPTQPGSAGAAALWVPQRREKKMRRGGRWRKWEGEGGEENEKGREVKKMRRGGRWRKWEGEGGEENEKGREVKKENECTCDWDYIVLSQESVCVGHQTAVGRAHTQSAAHLVHCAATLSAAGKGTIWSHFDFESSLSGLRGLSRREIYNRMKPFPINPLWQVWYLHHELFIKWN